MDAGTFAVSALLLVALVREHRVAPAPGPPESAVREAVAGARLVWSSRRLRGLLAWGLLTAASVIAAEGLAVAIADEQGGGPLAAGSSPPPHRSASSSARACCCASRPRGASRCSPGWSP